MKLETLWTSSDTDPVGKVLNVADLFTDLPGDFPVFQQRFTESKLQQLERWGREHKELADRQTTFVLHHLCRHFVIEMRSREGMYLQSEDNLCSKLAHSFDILVAQRHLQYMRITSDPQPEANSYALTAVYQQMASLKTHTIHVCNLPNDK